MLTTASEDRRVGGPRDTLARPDQNPRRGFLPAGGSGSRRVAPDEVRDFLRQCSLRAEAGLPLLEAMAQTAAEVLNPAFSRVLCKVRRDLGAGRSLSAALALHPQVFPGLLVSYTRAGEESGCVERLWTWYAEQQQVWDNREPSYRLIIVFWGIASAAILSLLLFILPQFEEIFQGMRIELPLPTMVLLQLSALVVRWWYGVIPGMLFGPVFLWRRRHDPRLAHLRDALLDRVPWLKSRFRRSGFARLAKVLALLLESRIPVVNAVEIAAASSGNPTLERSARLLQENVAVGMRLSKAMSMAGILPSEAVGIRISSAEEEGDLIPVLQEIARDYDREGARLFELFSKLIEPLVIVGFGLIIGAIVLSVFMPMACMCNCAVD